MNLTRSKFFRRSLGLAFAAVVAGGCTDFSSSPAQLGHLIVTAKDASGTGVQGINFTLLLSDRIQEWAKVSTSADGSAEFRAKDKGVLPQQYIVRFDALNGNYRGESDSQRAAKKRRTSKVHLDLSRLGEGASALSLYTRKHPELEPTHQPLIRSHSPMTSIPPSTT